MGFLKNLFSNITDIPPWYYQLQDHFKPSLDKVRELERLRSEFNIPQDLFALAVVGSVWGTIRAQEFTRDQLRTQLPGTPEKGIWQGVLLSRFQTIMLHRPEQRNDILKIMESMDELMGQINTWQDVVDYILWINRNYISTDPSGIPMMIDRILMNPKTAQPAQPRRSEGLL